MWQWYWQFLPRDAVHKRGLCCGPVSVCPSVCLSRSCILSRRLKISSNFFISSVAHHSSCLTSGADTQFQGNPFSESSKYKGWENFAIFDWNRRLSQKRYEIGPWLLWNVNRKSYALYRMVTFAVTLTDL